jgi:hypothetical protein
MNSILELDAPSSEPAFQMERRYLTVDGVRRTLRLVRFASGWVASVDTPSGPTVGVDHSPYLAARRALEPIGIDLVEAMTVVGRLGQG